MLGSSVDEEAKQLLEQLRSAMKGAPKPTGPKSFSPKHSFLNTGV